MPFQTFVRFWQRRYRSFRPGLRPGTKALIVLVIMACGPMPYDLNEFVSYFLPETASTDPTLKPYRFTAQFLYEDEGDTLRTDRVINTQSWQQYLGTQDALVGASLYGNRAVLMQRATRRGKQEAAEYLAFLDRLEPVLPAPTEPWETPAAPDSAQLTPLLNEAATHAATARDAFVRERYAYQAVRLAGTLRQYALCQELYQKTIKAFGYRSALADWARCWYAGATLHRGDSARAFYEFAQVFDRCPSRRLQADLSVRTTGTHFHPQALTFCQNDQERAAVYALAVIQPWQDGLPFLKEMARLDPANPLLEVGMAREINKNERFALSDAHQLAEEFYDDSLYLAQQVSQAPAYAEQLRDFAQSQTTVSPLRGAAFWWLATSYLNHLTRRPEKAREALENAQAVLDTLPKSSQQQYQLRQTQLLAALYVFDRHPQATPELEAEVIPVLEKLQHPTDFRSNNTWEEVCQRLANLYRQAGKPARKSGWLAGCFGKKEETVPFASAKALLAQMLTSHQWNHVPNQSEYGEYNGFYDRTSDLYALEDSLKAASVEGLIAYATQAAPGDFDKRFLKLAPLSPDYLYTLLGRRALAEHQYAKAAAAFEKVNPKVWQQEPFQTYLDENPFALKPGNGESPRQRYTPPAFARRMAELEARAKSGSAAAYYQLGCGAYNMSYYGTAWVLTRRGWSSAELRPESASVDYYTARQALAYFQKAAVLDKTGETGAKATFASALCAKSVYEAFDYLLEYAGETQQKAQLTQFAGGQKRDFNRYFAQLSQAFPKTAYTQEAIRECSSYRIFSGKK